MDPTTEIEIFNEAARENRHSGLEQVIGVFKAKKEQILGIATEDKRTKLRTKAPALKKAA